MKHLALASAALTFTLTVAFSATAYEPSVKDIQSRAAGNAAQQKFEMQQATRQGQTATGYDTLAPAAGGTTNNAPIGTSTLRDSSDEDSQHSPMFDQKFKYMKN